MVYSFSANLSHRYDIVTTKAKLVSRVQYDDVLILPWLFPRADQSLSHPNLLPSFQVFSRIDQFSLLKVHILHRLLIDSFLLRDLRPFPLCRLVAFEAVHVDARDSQRRVLAVTWRLFSVDHHKKKQSV